MYNVDIDTGGTMTDGLVSGEGKVVSLKVETTPHDVTIAFVDILEAARDELGFDSLRAFLKEVEVIRWSSTITSNVLALRVGPKLGLLVTKGHEHDLYDAAAAGTVIGSLVSAEDITGIDSDADEHEVLSAVLLGDQSPELFDALLNFFGRDERDDPLGHADAVFITSTRRAGAPVGRRLRP